MPVMDTADKTAREFLKEIGAKGGAKKSKKKTLAVRKNLDKARIALAKKRRKANGVRAK